MYEDWLIGREQLLCFFYSSTCVEQRPCLVAYPYVESEIMISVEIVGYLLCKMMDVDHHPFESRFLEFLDHMPEERFSVHLHQRFRHGVGEWT